MKMKIISLAITTTVFTMALFVQSISAQQQTEKNYAVNTRGTGLYQITDSNNKTLVATDGNVFLTNEATGQVWRKTNLQDGHFFLDFEAAPPSASRLRATSYLGVNMTTQGLEGVNDDKRWRIIELTNGNIMLQHKSSGRFLFAENDSVYLTNDDTERPGITWSLELKKLDLESIESPILLMGDDMHGFRDPAVIRHNGMYYMYYSFVKTEEDEKIYWYVAWSKSEDLVSWSEPQIFTPKDQNKNFGSPGNVIRWDDHWVICMQTYVMPDYTRRDPLRFGNQDCRIWIMRSFDLENWSEPEMLEVHGPGVDPGHMIDAYLLEDKDEKGKWWAFFKQRNPNGTINYSYSYDLKEWQFEGATHGGENVCAWVENDEYYVMHSPEVGMEIIKSSDMKNWEEFSPAIELGKENWPWAGQRVTAGFVMDLRDDPTVGKYVMFFHGQGPAPKTTEIINSGTDLGIAWSDDLLNWDWPGKE